MATEPAVQDRPGYLPEAVTSFVGRRRELAALKVRMSEARLLTLVGAPGVGKTRLAAELAAMSRRAFPDGVWMVDLASLDDPEKVPQAVLSALNVAEPTGDAQRAAAPNPGPRAATRGFVGGRKRARHSPPHRLRAGRRLSSSGRNPW